MTPRQSRALWVFTTVAIVAGLLWLDSHRAGPASELSQCNLALTRSDAPAADVLVAGSSRTGVAVDPVAMQAMLGAAGLEDSRVDRIALGRNPLRANASLIDNYFANRGAPTVIVLELSFLTERTVDRINKIAPGTSADTFLYRRDVNLMDFGQILSLPAVARPFTEAETSMSRIRYNLEGLTTRSGALVYQAASDPTTSVTIDRCSKERWTREPEWPADFAFSWDDAATIATPRERIDVLQATINEQVAERELKPWQVDVPATTPYPYDVDQPYRLGEVLLLEQVIDRAAAAQVPVVLLPMTLYGMTPRPDDVSHLNRRFAGDARVFDLYAATGVDLSTYWYDDAHLELGPATELTTAVLTQYLLDSEALTSVNPDGDDP